MVAQKCFHYLRRMQDMGLHTAWWLTSNRIKKRLFLWRHRQKWLPKDFRRTNTPAAQPPLFCLVILNDPLFQAQLPNQCQNPATIYHLADQAGKPCIKLLGFGTYCFNDFIPWHRDVTTNTPSPTTWQTALCSTITPQDGFDIKVPWELSRLQHLFPLGLGYNQAKQTGDHQRAATYAAAFVTQVTNWMDNNPYLIGVNWTNPMEVAIRSINLTWAYALFHDASMIPPAFWQQLTTNLHRHRAYLAHTWEVSDRPNNHYLADLVGHAYLSALFGITNKKLIQTTVNQFLHQTNANGSCYEGSTAYHRLDTELLLHFILLCTHTNQPIPTVLRDRYHAIQSFLQDCTDHTGNMVQIGDNDSGSIVAGLQPKANEASSQTTVTTYKDFGLTVIKTPTWHITFRHPTYTTQQPTGHFHQDWLAITVSVNGIPIFIDPGSYCYTANPTVRNQFRSAESHNTFYPSNASLQATDLFQLPRMAHAWTGAITQTAETITVADRHYEYKKYGGIAHRSLQLNTTTNVLTIEDWWEPCGTQTDTIATNWTLLCAPTCNIKKHTETTVEITHNGKPIVAVTTPFACQTKPAWFSPTYGTRETTTKLTSQTIWTMEKKRTNIRLI